MAPLRLTSDHSVDSVGRRLRRGVTTLLLAGFLLAVTATDGSLSPLPFAWFAAVFLLLAAAVVAAAELLARVGPLSRALAALAVGLFAAWHLREQTLWLNDPWSFAAAALGGAFLIWLALTPPPPTPESRTRAQVRLAASALLLAMVFSVGFQSSELLRWHALHHARLLGTPAYYLGQPRIVQRQERLFAEQLAQRPVPPAAGGGAAALAVSPAPGGAPPNLVYLLLDTLRADELAAYGGGGPMPYVDQLLASAWLFTDVRSTSSWTHSAVGTLFTGKAPEEHGARRASDLFVDDNLTLAEILQQRGYRTVAFVTNVSAVGRAAGFAQGFDEFHEFPEDPYARAVEVKRRVLAWLARRPAAERGAPLFLYLHFLDPHEPYQDGMPREQRPEPYRAAYREQLRTLDRELAELLPAVRAALGEPTRLLVVSDHGEEFWEHGLFGHAHTLYDEVLRIPVALAGGEGRGEVDAALDSRDLFDLALAVAADVDLDPAVWARSRARPRRYASLYTEGRGRLWLRPYLRHVAMRAVEEEDWKLVWSAYGDTRELYHRPSDPGERRNLIAREPARAERLSAALDAETPVWRPAVPFAASAEERRQLEALGYAD